MNCATESARYSEPFEQIGWKLFRWTWDDRICPQVTRWTWGDHT